MSSLVGRWAVLASAVTSVCSIASAGVIIGDLGINGAPGTSPAPAGTGFGTYGFSVGVNSNGGLSKSAAGVSNPMYGSGTGSVSVAELTKSDSSGSVNLSFGAHTWAAGGGNVMVGSEIDFAPETPINHYTVTLPTVRYSGLQGDIHIWTASPNFEWVYDFHTPAGYTSGVIGGVSFTTDAADITLCAFNVLLQVQTASGGNLTADFTNPVIFTATWNAAPSGRMSASPANSMVAVPEPASAIVVLGLASGALALRRRRS